MTSPRASTPAGDAGANASRPPIVKEEGAADPAFIAYCLFIVSYFLHMGNRVGILGALRIDILLCGVAFISMIARKKPPGAAVTPMDTISKLLWALTGYVLISLPLVKWPGSVLGHGWEPFVKAMCFYLLTVGTVTTRQKLKWFLIVFVGVQVFRVFEPLYLHFTQGYWGSFTGIGNWEYMDRLSGAPFDIINPNGLAFVILVALCLMHQQLFHGDGKSKLLYLCLAGPLMYAMLLTSSRSGFLVLVLFALLQIWRSKHRVVAFTVAGVIAVVLLATLTDVGRERYLSIVDKNARGASTAQGRIDGIWTDFKVGLENPVFGHGLGTSAEANFNSYGEGRPSHTLYTEVLQELGFIGLGIFVAFIWLTARNCILAVRLSTGGPDPFLYHTAVGARDFCILLTVFSIASYGLNEYQWYLLAGLSVVMMRILRQGSANHPATVSAAASAAGQATRPRVRPSIKSVR